ncbi:MAG: hypothetical protein O7173_01595 [Wolbachia endosymbiont of Nomada fabriciana]|uniref:hypothetical protein n=1 Tax=unclassified Wolbachia TaxID=2640676 RepID=UPI00222012AE|nr:MULTISPECIES: hypothetical protein [unclassified Wolbachia]MDX5496353.1 hypothetical protein [Wolbachia endosymbiont of Nomada fabriciana]MDX5507135.1 hypothetical protein [Wolbachia endosymbiont of Hylaeus sinuatus]MDX5526563.1 hypothetical protein [Wolbachia endosymbiont of Andrena nigroaenea]MDX5527998.1 hypothetical protein [Wolbachia endosymbiont of Andrena minutula]MDX5543145.1 hypothetical protein [Wolbachia endosymbiont of Andrena apicata]
MLNSTETVSLIGTSSNLNISSSDNNPISDTKNVPKYVTLNNEEEWNEFFIMQNNTSTNITNKKKPKPYIHKDSNGIYTYTARDENKYGGKNIIGKVAEQIKEAISKNIENNDIEFIKLKESKNEDNIIEPAVRIAIGSNTKEISMSDILNNDLCKQYGVKAITLLLPQSKARGLRCRVDEHGTRIYEVANGSYQMTLKWNAQGKECNIKINIHDNGSVELIEGNGVTMEQLAAHKEVKVGRQYEAKPLHEVLASQLPQTQLQQSSEEVKFLEQHSTNVEDLSGASQKHQAPAASK